MSGMWNRTLIYLGLREEPDETYDELPQRFVPEDDPHAAHATGRGASPRPAAEQAEPHARAAAEPRAAFEAEDEDATVRPLRPADGGLRAASGGLTRAAVVEVGSFDDVEAVGARFRTGQPVLFDASTADRATARRVLDFVSGVTYALGGRLTKAAPAAFLLIPDGVVLPDDELRRLGDLGYRLQTGSDA